MAAEIIPGNHTVPHGIAQAGAPWKSGQIDHEETSCSAYCNTSCRTKFLPSTQHYHNQTKQTRLAAVSLVRLNHVYVTHTDRGYSAKTPNRNLLPAQHETLYTARPQ